MSNERRPDVEAQPPYTCEVAVDAEQDRLTARNALNIARYRQMVALVSGIQLLTAIFVVASWSVPMSTALAPLSNLLGGRPAPVASALVLASALAIYSLFSPRTRFSAVFVLPQQFILALAAYSTLTAIFGRHYADGVVRPWQFIATDQVVITILFISYTMAVIRRPRFR